MKHDKFATDMYVRLLAMAVLSFVSMYFLMYAMVDRFPNIHNSINEIYMAGLMTAPMILIELVLMGAMYQNKNLNIVVALVSVIVGMLFFLAIRGQWAVGDKQFLRSMIPHHAGAILMCNNASIRDTEIQQLCNSIIAGQQKEIDEMKAILGRL